jgi:hypothetical protein
MDVTLKEKKEEMMATLMAAIKASPVRMEANKEKLKATDLETNPEETEATVETIGALKDQSGGPASGYKALLTAKQMNPVRWWAPAEVGCCLWAVYLPCHSAPCKGWTLERR